MVQPNIVGVLSGKADATHFGRFHEYILCYAKNATNAQINLLPRTEEMNARYSNPDDDTRGSWLSNDLTAAGERSNGHFEVRSPSGAVFNSPQGKHWLYSQESMERLLAENRIWFGQQSNAFPRLKRFLSEVQQGRRVNTVWLYNEVGSTDEATKEFKALFSQEEAEFPTPKPTRLIKQILQIATTKECNDIVLDFFSGSGTTAQAVLELNRADGGNRRFVLVQLPEQTGNPKFPTIAEIGKERIRRVVARMKQQPPLDTREVPEDLGFKVWKLGESNFRQMQPTTPGDTQAYLQQLELMNDALLPGSETRSVLYEVALREGFGLNAQIEALAEVAGVWRVTDREKDQSFYASLEDSVVLENLLPLNLRADDLFVCRGIALDDTTAANLTLQCRLKMI